MILGLDISTSCTGLTILDSDKNLIFCDYIDTSKFKSMYEKAAQIKKMFCKLNLDFEIKHIFVEENLQKFRPGFSSAKTLTTLSKFNGVVCYIANESFKHLHSHPVNINVINARKSLGMKIEREKKCGVSTKEQVLRWVSTDCSKIKWPTKILKSGPRKGKEVYIPACYDMADSYVIASSGLVHMMSK